MTVVTDPYSVTAGELETIIKAEFFEEKFPVRHDRLHESLGYNGTVIGISPEDEVPNSGKFVQMDMTILVQFYGKYDLEVNNEQHVDPRKVTNFAERFRQAVAGHTFYGTSEVWYFDIISTRYPKDPTGNKSRFEATIRAYGNNSGLVETG